MYRYNMQYSAVPYDEQVQSTKFIDGYTDQYAVNISSVKQTRLIVKPMHVIEY